MSIMIQQYLLVLAKLLKHNKLYLFLIPGAIITFFYLYFRWLFGWLGAPEELAPDAGWWARMVNTIQESGKWVLQTSYQFIMITILSPVMAILAERADNHLSGSKFDGGLKRMITDLLRTIAIVFTALWFFIVVYLVWNLFALLLGITALTPYVMFFINAFFIGFAYTDYALERYKVSLVKSWNYGFKNSWTMVGLGALFTGVFYIPYLGALAAPFLITLLATSVWHVKENKGSAELETPQNQQ